MFDIGFSEIVVIAVVALIVIGPEKLPKTARTLGHLFGRLQRYVNDVKADINREIELDELRKLQKQVQTAAKDIEMSFSSAASEVESSVRAVESDLNAAAADTGHETAAPEMRPLAAPAAEPAPAAPAPAPAIAAPAAQPAAEPQRQASLPGFERG
jgi:sec-independent protein translocase protein TatB